MNEGMNISASPEAKKEQQEREDAERLTDYLARHPEPVISKENLREAGPEITEFEAMVVSFEAAHSLEKLHSIVELSSNLAELFKRADDLEDPRRIENDIRTYEKHNPKYVPIYKQKIADARAIVLRPEDKANFELRRAAKKDLAPIIAKLNTIKTETNISPEKYAELQLEYKHLARALGSIKTTRDENKVDHS